MCIVVIGEITQIRCNIFKKIEKKKELGITLVPDLAKHADEEVVVVSGKCLQSTLLSKLKIQALTVIHPKLCKVSSLKHPFIILAA